MNEVIYQGTFELLKRGRQTIKNPDGVTTPLKFPWRVAVDEEGYPCVVAAAAGGGMQYAMKLTKGSLEKAIREIERTEDRLRAERNGDF